VRVPHRWSSSWNTQRQSSVAPSTGSCVAWVVVC